MPNRILTLKCGKRLGLPALFLHPLHHEGKILRETILDPTMQTQQLAGIVVSMKDWAKLSQTLFQPPLIPNPRLENRIRIIDPELHLLFTGLDSDKCDLLETRLASGKLGDKRIPDRRENLRETILSIARLEGETPASKAKRYIESAYPYMSSVLFDVLRYVIDAGTDLVVGPSVPITSRAIALNQIEMADRMNRDSKALFSSVFSNYSTVTDFMTVITVNAQILESVDYCERLISSVVATQPDHVGIKVLDLDERDVARVEAVLRFIASLRSAIDVAGLSIPVHVFNVREFGYVTFCHGASSIEMPIARKPYIYINRNNPPDPSQLGRYTHPIDMIDYTYDQLEEMSANNGLPCPCKPCQDRGGVGDKGSFNEFRKKHFIRHKSGFEMQEVRDAEPASLHVALNDKFARSKQTGLVAYLEQIVAAP